MRRAIAILIASGAFTAATAQHSAPRSPESPTTSVPLIPAALLITGQVTVNNHVVTQDERFGTRLHLLTRHESSEVARGGSILTNLSSGSSRSFAGLGCLAPSSAVASASGVAAAAAVAATTQRPPLSSLNP